jgi:hypothetical protein
MRCRHKVTLKKVKVIQLRRKRKYKIDSFIFTTLCYFVSNFMIEEPNIGEYPENGWIS